MEFKERVKNASSYRTHVWYMGQAGFLIKNKKGELLGHDLYLSDSCERREGSKGFHRLQPTWLLIVFSLPMPIAIILTMMLSLWR